MKDTCCASEASDIDERWTVADLAKHGGKVVLLVPLEWADGMDSATSPAR